MGKFLNFSELFPICERRIAVVSIQFHRGDRMKPRFVQHPAVGRPQSTLGSSLSLPLAHSLRRLHLGFGLIAG
jgi:hypothetical protein